MFAIAFDMIVKNLRENYGEPYNNAYYDISVMMEKYGFYRVQGSLYMTESEDFSSMFSAMMALKSVPWFRKSVRDIRAFRVENWSDFTAIIQQ